MFKRVGWLPPYISVEIAGKIDELYARSNETQLGRRAAEIAHREEVERMDVFRRHMATEAQNAEVGGPVQAEAS